MALYTLDRIIDGQTAVLPLRGDESQKLTLSLAQLPKDVKEGDILDLLFSGKGQVESAAVQEEETEAALIKAKSLLDKLKNK